MRAVLKVVLIVSGKVSRRCKQVNKALSVQREEGGGGVEGVEGECSCTELYKSLAPALILFSAAYKTVLVT